MKFMIFVKATKDSEAGVMPSEQEKSDKPLPFNPDYP